jgi:hypothetical protein
VRTLTSGEGWRGGFRLEPESPEQPHPLERPRVPLAALCCFLTGSVLHKLNYDFVDDAFAETTLDRLDLRTEGGISNHLFMPHPAQPGRLPGRSGRDSHHRRTQPAVPSLIRAGSAPALPKRSGKRRAHIPIEKPVKL